jgi:CRP-like cAMP-binding protein
LIEKLDSDKCIFLIESGLIEVIQTRQEKDIRIWAYSPGMVVGEMTIYTGLPRSAYTVSRRNSVVYKLDESRLTAMENEHPDLAIKLHRYFARNLSLKLMDEVRFGYLRK